MKDYTVMRNTAPSLQQRGLESVFNAHYKNTLEGFEVTIDGKYKKKALIQKHSNPINSHLEDKYFTILKKDEEGLKWGSYVEGYGNNKYIVLTYPETTDGVTLKSKIRKTTGTCLFTLETGERFAYDCIDTNYLIYDDKTYKTDTVVFEDDDRVAIVIPYTDLTSKLRVIDDVELNGLNYKIIKIEFITEPYGDEQYGIVQLVLIRTTFGSLFCNNQPLRGMVRFARMKDKVLNSKSRELITDHNQVKSGDYIKHSYFRDGFGNIETRYYIVRSLIDMHLDYDITYIINCDAEFYMWDNYTKQPIMIPCYVEDNRTRFEESDRANVIYNMSQYQIIVQENEFTKKLGNEVNRIIIKGKCYEVVGTDNISLENAIYIGLVASKIDPNNDNLDYNIADFTSQYKDTNISNSIYIEGEDNCIIGCTYDFKAINTLHNGTWSVDGISYLSDNNTISLTIPNKVKDIGKKIILSYEEDGITYIKEINIKGW